MKLAAINKASEKYVETLKLKTAEIDKVLELYKEFKTVLELNNIEISNKKISKPDYDALIQKTGTRPTGYIKTALEAPQEGAQAPGQGLYHVTKKTRLNAF